MAHTVFIDGEAGTTGLRIRDRLSQRQDIALVSLPPEDRKEPARRKEALNDADFAILCLPDGAAEEAVGMVSSPRVRIIDAGSRFRTHPGWVYGLPELGGDTPDRIASAHRVANPGCFATGAILLLRPLVQAGFVQPEAPIAVFGVSGYSAGGRRMIERYRHPTAPNDLALYPADLAHRHIPEIQTHAGLARAPVFSPSIGPFYSGMMVQVALPRGLLQKHGIDRALLLDLYGAAYARFDVTIADQPDSPMRSALMADRDDVRLDVVAAEDSSMYLLVARFDNLGKGSSGAAVANLDLMLP